MTATVEPKAVEASQAGGLARHAPGPWRIEGQRAGGYIISWGVNSHSDGPEGYVGVFGPMFAGGSSSLAADARLIAAAPDMAGLLQNLLDCGIINGVTVEVTEGAREAVRKLLAKAHGQ